MKKVKGYLTDSGVFYNTKQECAIEELVCLFCEYVDSASNNAIGIQNAIFEKYSKITELLKDVEL